MILNSILASPTLLFTVSISGGNPATISPAEEPSYLEGVKAVIWKSEDDDHLMITVEAGT